MDLRSKIWTRCAGVAVQLATGRMAQVRGLGLGKGESRDQQSGRKQGRESLRTQEGHAVQAGVCQQCPSLRVPSIQEGTKCLFVSMRR